MKPNGNHWNPMGKKYENNQTTIQRRKTNVKPMALIKKNVRNQEMIIENEWKP